MDQSELPATYSQLTRLHDEAVLDDAAYHQALSDIGIPDDWWRQSGTALLCLAVAFGLAGTVYLFAFNWAQITPFWRFLLLQSLIVIAVGAALHCGLGRLPGQVAIFAAIVLAGILLAIEGQTYQTGADNYQIFALWSVLTLPWLIASRSRTHFLVWTGITNVAIWLFWSQVIGWRWNELDALLLTVGLFNWAALCMQETALKEGDLPNWQRYLHLVAALFPVCLTASVAIHESLKLPNTAHWGSLIALCGWGVWYYGFRKYSQKALVLIAVALFAFSMSISVYVCDEMFNGRDLPMLVGCAISAFNLTLTLVIALTQRRLQARTEDEAEQTEYAWPIKALMGSGAWLASIFAVFALFDADLIDDNSAWGNMLIGLIALLGALIIRRHLMVPLRIAQLMLFAAGNTLFLMGAANLRHEELHLALGAMAICVLVHLLQKDRLFRFVMVLQAHMMAALWLDEARLLMILAIIDILAICWILGRQRPGLRPMALALALSLTYTTMIIDWDLGRGTSYPLQLVMAIVVLLMVRRLSEPRKSVAMWAALLLVICVPPAVLTALALSFLGLRWRQHLVALIAAIAMPIALYVYYCSLADPLWLKGVLLIAAALASVLLSRSLRSEPEAVPCRSQEAIPAA